MNKDLNLGLFHKKEKKKASHEFTLTYNQIGPNS